ncbi:MAG: LacI family transcriptional regulator [Frankiales bacterium]|nr:LacI family transcriptional regulator [Frankiales bacterium]
MTAHSAIPDPGAGVSVTLADVARAAGVHPGTASKALNPDTRHRVAAATVRRIMATASELGYQPNTLARGLRTRRSFTVGLLLPDLTNPLFPPIVRGVEEVLGANGLIALVVNTDNDSDRALRLFAALRARQCDGFVLATARRVDPLVEEAAAHGIPAVLVNRLTDKRLLPAVAGDEAAGIRDAVLHLTELGHRRIGHVAGPQELSTGLIRHRAFVDATATAGLSADDCPVLFAAGYSEAAGQAAISELLAGADEPPTAIVAGNDLLALGVIDALRASGLTCPKDVSVVGFNDMPFMTRVQPALTTVHLPKREMGVQAARLLQERIEDASTPDARCLLLPCPLVVRKSTGPVRRHRVRG